MNTNAEASVTIEFQEPLDGETSSDIQQLANLIQSNSGLVVRGGGEDAAQGAKADPTSILAVIGAVTGVAGLVLQAIGIWKQDKPKYSITITEGGRTHTIENLSREDYLGVVQRLNASPANTRVSVHVSKRGKE